MAKRLTQEDFINRSKKIHDDKYDYSKVKYINTYTKVEIICQIHGSFFQDPHNHFKGKGCPLCDSTHKLTQSEFIQKATIKHNGFYDYSQILYEKSSAKIKIICPIHGAFEQEANSHLQGHGCPVCALSKIKNSDYNSRVKTRIKTCYKRYGVANTMQVEQFKKKNISTKLINGTFNSSKIEDDVYDKLVAKFGKTDVLRQYKSIVYPYYCDFYIQSLDLYIEINAFWTHNTHWFDETDEIDVLKKNQIISKYGTSWGEVWWISDVRKRLTAIKNNLNYIVLWNQNDVIEWFDKNCPIGNDAIKQYSWK